MQYIMDSQHPDVITGIDMGTSGTAVAFATPKPDARGPVKVITKWGNVSKEDKVPTQVVYKKDYDKNSKDAPIAWGFDDGTQSGGTDGQIQLLVGNWFKQKFCPSQSSAAAGIQQSDGKLPDVDILYEHFLSKLYEHIENVIHDTVLSPFGKAWKSASIEFLFSVPATWNSSAITKFNKLAGKAGFGSQPRHVVTTSLTEPQAVAAFEVNKGDIDFRNGDGVLVIDAGGGTVDLCLVEIDRRHEDRISLSELNPTIGEDVGSTFIDGAFQDLAYERLMKAGIGDEHNPPERLAFEMVMSQEFQDYKCLLGDEYVDKDEVFSVRIPKLDAKYSSEESDIKRGNMTFRWGQLMSTFDEEINKIAEMIDVILENISLSQRVHLQKHIILSGGLGSSAYVGEQLRTRFNRESHEVLRDAEFHVSSAPRLCVCQGLVYERLCNLYEGTSTFTQLRASSSFGILKHKNYDSKRRSHELAREGNKLETIPGDDGSWVPDCVDWLILRGDVMRPGKKVLKEVLYKFNRDQEESKRICQVTVVSSLDEPPPQHYTPKNGVLKHRSMFCNYSTLKPSSERKWYGKRRKQLQVEFKVQATFGVSGVEFECLSPDGTELLSGSPIAIPAKATSEEIGFQPGIIC
ncbi:hypothetical protein F5Y04DRAFT_292015 [Hypomontagnella monticulosa]|nr:hypothetical protein F5Y04DRAFT_292015 [Hypomontagnella monticulosa]